MPTQDNFFRRLKPVIVFFLFTLLMIKTSAQKDAIDAFIQKQMQQQKITGLTIGIVKNGRTFMSKGYGFANLEYKIPASDNTVFKLASISKHMVATGIMLLAQEGKLKLTDSITKYFPDAPAAWNAITIRHLLNHTSGLPRESPAFQSMRIQPDSLVIRGAYKSNLVYATGTSWQYCNLGYFMLADIIRQMSGRSFPEFMKEKIFHPYGLASMQTTTLNTIIPYRADGYVQRGGDTIENAENNIALRPSGAFISTMNDLLKWEMLMQQNKLLTTTNWLQMRTDTVPTTYPNMDDAKVYYGYGWNVTRLLNRTFNYHGGSLPGFRNLYCRFPNEKTAIIILTNTEPVNAMPIAKGIAEILFKQ